MLLMEGNLGSETLPPPPVAGDTVRGHHLTWSNSDAASSLTAENCKDSFRRPKNVTPDECTTWTNEKHNSYLHHLEMSFVEQLNQSKSVLARFSEHNMRDLNVSRRQLMNMNGASNQYDVLQKINCTAAEPIPSSKSADSQPSLANKRTHHSKHRVVHCHPSPTSRKLIGTWKQGKEGTGQNFLDELNSESQGKKLKVALGDGSLHDQIVPSSSLLQSTIVLYVWDNSARCECVSNSRPVFTLQLEFHFTREPLQTLLLKGTMKIK